MFSTGKNGSRTIATEENCSPTLTLTLTLSQTLSKEGGEGGNFPPGQLSAKTKETKHRKEIRNTRRKKTEDAKFYKIKTNFSE